MSSPPNPAKLSVAEFAEKIRGEMIPLSNRFSYFFTALSLTEDDIKEYLEEPIASLPPGLCAALPPASILLVPYLERTGDKEAGDGNTDTMVCFEKPEETRQVWSSKLVSSEKAVAVFALKDQDVADYHHSFFRLLAEVVTQVCLPETPERFCRILRDELSGGAHGEVDEESWQLKQALLRRQSNVRRKTKGFVSYSRQSFRDTLTLYLHGICCDIDVETGPRQIASRHLRSRLEFLRSLYPPPDGYSVFPEDLNDTGKPPASHRPAGDS